MRQLTKVIWLSALLTGQASCTAAPEEDVAQTSPATVNSSSGVNSTQSTEVSSLAMSPAGSPEVAQGGAGSPTESAAGLPASEAAAPSTDPATPPNTEAPLAGTQAADGTAQTSPETVPDEAAAGTQTDDAAAAAPGDMANQEPLLPGIDDPATAGPFTFERIDNVANLPSHILLVPDEPGVHGKHPLVIWTNGNSSVVDFYISFLEHLASHGFLVIADKDSLGADRQAEVASQVAALDWAFAENERAASPYAGLLDTEHVAVMGHSLGSLASFGGGSDPRVTTSIHYSGGITDNPVGFDDSWLQKLHAPAAFLCGANDTAAGESCKKDFAMAQVPVFLGLLIGADHIGPFFSEPAGGQYGRAGVAWLRWQLANDTSYRDWFVGADCTLCSGAWDGMARSLP